MLSSKSLKFAQVLAATYLLSASVLPSSAAQTPLNPSTQVMKAFTAVPQAQLTKWSNATCGAYYQLAPMSHQTIWLGHTAGLKNKAVNKHVKGLVPCSTIVSSKDTDTVSLNLAEPIKESMDMSDTSMIPVAFCSQSGSSLLHQNQMKCQTWSSSQIEQLEESKLSFQKGEAAVSADRPMQFQFAGTMVSLREGTIVLLRQGNGLKRVVNLYDKSRDAVSMETAGTKIFLRPGQECIVASSEDTLKNFRRRDGSIRRFSKLVTCPDSGETMGVCEISIPSLIKNHPIVKSIYLSNEKSEKQVSEKLLKMSVCLAHFSRSFAEYTQDK